MTRNPKPQTPFPPPVAEGGSHGVDPLVEREEWCREFRELLIEEHGRDVERAFRKLESGGCDLEQLTLLLLLLHHSCLREPVGKTYVERVAHDARHVARLMRGLGKSAIGLHIDPSGQWQNLVGKLESYVERLEALAPTTTGRTNPAEANALGRIFDYVKESTGGPHDSDVETICSAVLGRRFAARQRRTRRVERAAPRKQGDSS